MDVKIMQLAVVQNVVRKSTSFFLFVCALAFSGSSMAFSLKVSDAEFSAWDQRCQAYYIRTQVGRISPHRTKVPSNVVDYWFNQRSLDAAGPWHYCGGLVHYRRAQGIFGDPVNKGRELEKARNGALFTYRKLDPKHSWWPEIAVFLGRMSAELKDFSNASLYFDEVIRTWPQYAPGYIAKSIMLWDLDHKEEAIELLEHAATDMNIESAELYYDLGFFYVKEKQLEKAKVNAEKAYKLGYPLPGLKNMLKNRGISLELE